MSNYPSLTEAQNNGWKVWKNSDPLPNGFHRYNALKGNVVRVAMTEATLRKRIAEADSDS